VIVKSALELTSRMRRGHSQLQPMSWAELTRSAIHPLVVIVVLTASARRGRSRCHSDLRSSPSTRGTPPARRARRF
jgi:hypothetical protein